jgi:hypothetical protein
MSHHAAQQIIWNSYFFQAADSESAGARMHAKREFTRQEAMLPQIQGSHRLE